MKKKFALLFLIAAMVASLFAGGALAASAEETAVNGWHNVGNGNSAFTDSAGDTVITTAGNKAFGSSLALNETLIANVYGEYDLTFFLDAQLTKNEEVWLSVVGIYNDTSVLRTGLHFQNNDWLNIAVYGSLNGVDKGFSVISERNEKFPSLSSVVEVKLSYRYGEAGNTVENLYLNGELVLTADLTDIYGYYYVHSDAVGFDFYNASENVTVSNIRVTQSNSAKNYRKTNVNDFIYYGAEKEFTAQRLTTTVDTTDSVTGYTFSEQMTAGMFSNGKPHNYQAFAEIKSITPKAGTFEYGFYPWYKNVANYVLMKTDGAQFTVQVVVDGEITVNESRACASQTGDIFSFIKSSSSNGLTSIKAALKDVTIEVPSVEGIFENYYIGVYGKNVQVQFKNIRTTSFYVAYDFTEQGDWITSGASESAWTVEDDKDKYPVVELSDAYLGNTIHGVSVAVTTKMINDADAKYTMTFTLPGEGNLAFGVVPYYNSDGDYVLAGVERIGTQYALFVRSSKGVNETREIAAQTASATVSVERKGTNFVIYYGEDSLSATLEGITKISEYYGFFAAGNGLATVTSVECEGFISFMECEENGWIKTSVQKNDIRFEENGTISINGNYKEAGLTEGTDQQLAKAVRAENYKNDYVIDVDLTKTGEPDGQCQRLGVLAWYLNKDNYFVLFVDQWTVWEAFQLNGCGVYNGERMTDVTFNDYEWFLGSLDTPGYINQTFHLKVVKNAQTIRGYINDVLIFNRTFEDKYDLTVYEDDTLYLGVFAAGIAAKFENYTVRAMTDEEGTKTPSAGNRPVTPDPSKPEDNPKPSESDPSSKDKKGCGSVLSSSITSVFAVASVGVILKFVLKKKKEDIL